MPEKERKTEINLLEQAQKVQAERIKKAKEEIQAILDKYGVQLQGVITIPTNEIRIVPRDK